MNFSFRYNHFLPNSPSEGLRTSEDGDVISMFSLLSKVLGNSSTSQDSRFDIYNTTQFLVLIILPIILQQLVYSIWGCMLFKFLVF